MAVEGQKPALPSKSTLLGLAEEIQVMILLELGAVDILACTQVCHALADVVKRTPAVQYKLELGLAGMVDGPAKGVPVGKRLEQLRAYQATWRENDIPVQTVAIPYGKPRPYTKLLRPASLFSGVTEERKDVDVMSHLPPDTHVEGCAVDLAQDLLVVTQPELGELPQLWLLSISQNGAFHPLAAKPHYEGDEELSINIDPEETIEICGDLVAWTIATDSTSIIVLNWKTGRVVWRSGEWHDDRPNFHMRCYFLDPTHIVVVENLNLHIHEVSPTGAANPDCSYSAGLCTLRLPKLAENKGTHGMESDMKFPPVYPASTPLFQRDPALTVLALMFSACDDPMGYSRAQCKSFLALIPVATMLAQLEAATNEEQTAAATPAKARRKNAVPWGKWSPLGASLIEFEKDHHFDLCALGSQCMLIDRKQDGSCLTDVHVFDAHPLARHAPRAELDLSTSAMRPRKRITEPGWFAKPVESTLPYRIAHKAYSTKEEGKNGYATGPSFISHDALLGFCHLHRKKK